MQEQTTKKQITVLAGLSSPALGAEQSSDEASMEELRALVETAGGEVVAQMLQTRPAPEARTFLGEGKARELAELCRAWEADLVVVDNEISPAQTRVLSEVCDCAVLTRSGIILDIFAGRARTAEGKLQVELAQYKYLMPRLSGQGASLSRLGGGIGTRGPGETKLETDRRHIRGRIHWLEEELSHLSAVREQQRRARLKNSVPVVALVGYTNAGKSTLLNCITQAGIPANDRLFDTLDMTCRAFEPEAGMPALLTDTVGFIRRLPHALISAFEATLSELAYAEVLLHVIDCSDADVQAHVEVTRRLCATLARENTPVLRVYNKADLAPADLPRDTEGVYISAKTGEGVDLLLARTAELLKGSRRSFELLIPYADGAALNLLYRDGRVESVEHEDAGVRVRAVCDARLYAAVAKYDVAGAKHA